MGPDLLGYVLNALEPRDRAEVDAYVRFNPQAQAQVESVRQTLEPLSLDAEAPPPGLADRTLAFVEAHCPKVPAAHACVRSISWRRMIEAAAVVLLTVTAGGVGVSWLGRLRVQQPGGEPNSVQVLACKNNLREVYDALRVYGDAHERQFPNVAMAAAAPRNMAGQVISILQDSNLLPAGMDVSCPATSQNGYAYSIGYRQAGQVIGPRLDDGHPSELIPLMADSSPPNPLGAGQSANHGGSGQNVLYNDGHVVFCQSRHVGYNQDDIYLNRANKVAAGVDWSDAVLTSSAVPP